MRLPKDLLSNMYRKPSVYLCEVDKTKICKLETSNMQASLKFNSYSELSFEVGRYYNDIITGETCVNQNYDLIEALRLIYLEGFGYFEIQGPEIVGDGIKEVKQITAYSYEYTLSQKYLEDFYVNTGEVNSREVIGASSGSNIIPVTLYNPTNPQLSLLHLILKKDYAGWTIGHIDTQLQKLSRQFEIDRESIYDFLMNEVCEKFNCYIDFDTKNNEINVYAESPTVKFIGDGQSIDFKIPNSSSTFFSAIKTISINGYKTTNWTYDFDTQGNGRLRILPAPEKDAIIEVVGVDSTWETDVFISFDNLSQEIKIDYDADSIKTVLTVTFGDDNDIREVNLGLPYIVDLSYYCTPEWMGEDLCNAWEVYQEKCNENQAEYTKNTQSMLYYAGQIDYEENRLSLGYATATVNENTVGKYYVRGGTEPNYYYTEVSLPAEYNVNTTYYSTKTTNVEDGDDGNIHRLYQALKKYFMYADDWKTDMDALSKEFAFVGDNAITDLSSALATWEVDRVTSSEIKQLMKDFFAKVWNEIGRTPLQEIYYEKYKKIQMTDIEAGWAQWDHEEYGNYYAVVSLVHYIQTAIDKKDKIIADYKKEYKKIQSVNAAINDDLLISNNFSAEQLVRLNAFLREDELHLDDIITTSQDSVTDTYKNQQDALESGKIELQKLSQPQLKFSMSMANIYALPEFEPIVDQFQLGRVIKVGLRPDYIKQSRLLQVNINFDDFSDFSCEFGDLTNLRTQSDIHADLLKNAITAGKSVAQNAAYWTKGADQATSTDLKIEQGLLDAVESLKSMDGTQNVSLDKYGLHLEKIDPDTGEKDPEQVWLVNNKIVFTDDNFETSRMALGRVKVDGNEYYGIISEIMLAGYIEGSKMVGGTINIGNGAFVVHEDGTVTMGGGSGYVDQNGNVHGFGDITNQIEQINTSKMYRVEITTEDSTIISTADDKATITCKVYSWDADITDTLDASLFNWKRTSGNAESDAIWNAMPEYQGIKSIVIDADDVVGNSSFICEVSLPEGEESTEQGGGGFAWRLSHLIK